MTYRILAVDDEPAIVQLIAATLKARGHEVFEAMDGQQALATAKSEHPDLILLDIMMPRMDGHEVRRRLRADEATADIPVIYLSAVGDFESQLDSMEEDEAADYITKPFSPPDLAEHVEAFLDPRTHDTLTRQAHSKAGRLRTFVEIMHREREDE